MILSRSSYEVLKEEIPKYMGNYLEIGVYEGDMLRDFAQRWVRKTFYGIDPFISDQDTFGHHGVPVGGKLEYQRITAYENFKDIPNIIFIEESSRWFLANKTPQELYDMKVSVVYVDGSHTYDDTMTDLILASKLITNGLIYIDDFNLTPVLMATHDFVGLNEDRIVEYNERKILIRA